MLVTRGIGKKKGNTSKNCKFTDEELSTHYTDYGYSLIGLIRVKLSFYGLGLTHSLLEILPKNAF